MTNEASHDEELRHLRLLTQAAFAVLSSARPGVEPSSLVQVVSATSLQELQRALDEVCTWFYESSPEMTAMEQ